MLAYSIVPDQKLTEPLMTTESIEGALTSALRFLMSATKLRFDSSMVSPKAIPTL